MEIIPRDLMKLWESLDLRAIIMFSLSLQAFLLLFAPLRKRTCSVCVMVLVWSAFVLADWAAKIGLGLISSNVGGSNESAGNTRKANYDADVIVFWAPFLLLHLGGPRTITAFAMEDNELWNRHLIGLVIQSVAAIYAFIQTLPNNKLWLPTLLMFISGLINYAERTVSLYRASLDNFRDSTRGDPEPGPNYARLMHEYRWQKEANLPTSLQNIPEPARRVKSVNRVKEGKLEREEVVLYAHRFFDHTFKGLIVDLKFSSRQRSQSREFFLKRSPEDAFKVIGVELNFMYDILFTKANVDKIPLRMVSWALNVASLCLFCFEDKKLIPADVVITYALILGAIALDVLNFVRLIFSDGITVLSRKLPDVNLDDGDDDDKTAETEEEKNSVVGFIEKLVRLLHRRWSEHVSTYSLISYCLNPRTPEKQSIMDMLGFTKFFDGVKYVKHRRFKNELRDHIFEELRMKSEMADDLDTAKDVCAAKGEFVLSLEGCDKLLPYVTGLDYDQILLLWHIATELCYWDEIAGENPKAENNHKTKNNHKAEKDYRDFCKLLSEYMFYLLVMQPTLMSAVADIAQIRLLDTCADAQKFFNRESQYQAKANLGKVRIIIYVLISTLKYVFWFTIGLLPSILALIIPNSIWPRENNSIWGRRHKYSSPVVKFFSRDNEFEKNLRISACRDILNVNAEVKAAAIKGDKSQSVLFDGCRLAKDLKNPENTNDKWKIMSKVWVELLSHAAIHCRSQYHAQLLSRGGELITIVWLLMAHFGLGYQFRAVETRVKLVEGK